MSQPSRDPVPPNRSSQTNAGSNSVPKTKDSRSALFLIALITGGVFLLDSTTSRGYAVWLLYAVAVLLTAWVRRPKLSYGLAAICTLLVVAGFFLPLHGIHSETAIANRVLAVGTLWVLAALLERRQQAEGAVRGSEERLRLFIEHAPAAIAMFDMEMRYLSYSHRWLADYDLQGQELHGRSHYEVFPEIPERWKEVHRRGLAGTVARAEEDPFERADGRVQWLRWEVRPWHTASGEVGGIVIFTEDTTAGRLAEEALRESEERYRTTFEQSQDAVLVVDPTGQGRVLAGNPAATRLFGWSEQEMIGLTRQEVLDTDDPSLQRALVARVRVGAMRVEVTCKRRDGSTFTGELTSAVFADREGRPRAVAIIRDISERKRAEAERERLFAEAEEGRRLLEALMAYIPIGVTIADAPDVKIRLVSEYGRGVTGRMPAEIEGIAATAEDAHSAAWGIYHLDGVTPARDEELPLTRATKYGEAVTNEEWVLKRPDGTSLTVLCNAGPLRDATGAITGGIIVWRDISEMRRQAERLAAERTRAELAESLRRETAHRTKNNLAMVAGLLRLQVAQQSDPEVQAALSQTSARVATFASIQEELQSGTSEEVDLLPVLQRVASASTGAFAGGEVAISVRGEALPLPSSAVTNLALVGNELITNAIKYGAPGPEGTLRVEVVLDPGDHWVRLCVWNSGSPPPADFDPQAQSGLGLRLIYGIAVERYRGAFVLRAEAGGSLAEVTVPREALQEG